MTKEHNVGWLKSTTQRLVPKSGIQKARDKAIMYLGLYEESKAEYYRGKVEGISETLRLLDL